MFTEKYTSAINTTARFAGVDTDSVHAVLVSKIQRTGLQQELAAGKHATALQTVAHFAGISVEQALAGIHQQGGHHHNWCEVPAQQQAA
jgi:hypothetical protein